MSNIKTHTSNLLTIEVEEIDTIIEIRFKGRSIEREPGSFISPILLESLQKGIESNRRVRINFESLGYMNSSTITPLLKILENLQKSQSSISILYKKSKKWQELCFSALKIFETRDKRIEIVGK